MAQKKKNNDELSELDETRREYILKRIRGRQVIITDTDEKLTGVLTDARVIRVKNGKCL